MKTFCILKDGYVINTIVAADAKGYGPDEAIEDTVGNVGKGDFYEKSEGVFYRPLSIPPDLPEELKA